GVIAQDPFLFSATVRENIAFGRPDATDDQIEQAARLAQAHEFVEALPEGYDTVIGERGITLSGGQRQRIAIARALVVDPRILILDDATASVDATTESKMRGGRAQVDDWSWAQTKRRLATLYRLARPYRVQTTLAIVAMLGATAVALAPPYLVGRTVDHVANGSTGELGVLVTLFIAAGVL